MRAVKIAAVSIGLAFVSNANAASNKDWDACGNQDNPANAVQACSRILSDQSVSPADRADGYLFRAGAYLAQASLDLAIADYTEAIRLAPQNVTGYQGRGLALFNSGDRDQAGKDFAMISRLDPAKAVDLAAKDPDWKQIAALPSAHSVADAQPARAPFPKDLDLPEDSIKLLAANSLSAQAPAVALRTINYDFSVNSDWKGPGGTGGSTTHGKSQRKLESMGGGITKFDWNSSSDDKAKGPNPAPAKRSAMHITGISLGNGLFNLDEKMSFNFQGKQLPVTETKMLRIEKVSGTMFPMQLNNHLSLTAVFTTFKPGDSKNEYTVESDCKVSRQFDASSFNSGLTGKAFLGICENFRINADKSLSLMARDKKIFVEQLGYWIQADPVSPNERLMKDDETTMAGDATFRNTGTTVLKSFTLEP